MADPVVRIGSLRWKVTIARRRLNFDPPGGTGIFEDYVEVETVRAEVVPISALAFYGAEDVDTPVTHRITCRWLDYIDNSHVITRQTNELTGRPRNELFRIRRIKELAGRKRFSSIDAELEKFTLGGPP